MHSQFGNIPFLSLNKLHHSKQGAYVFSSYARHVTRNSQVHAWLASLYSKRPINL